MLKRHRLPVFVPGRVSSKPDPRPNIADAGGPGERIHRRVPQVEIVLVGVGDLQSLLAFQPGDVGYPLGLPEGALVEEIVPHPGVHHRGLR